MATVKRGGVYHTTYQKSAKITPQVTPLKTSREMGAPGPARAPQGPFWTILDIFKKVKILAGPRAHQKGARRPPGGRFWKPLLLGPGTFLAGAFYVTKKTDFLSVRSKNKVPGAILERKRAQGPGPVDRAQGGTSRPGPRGDQWTGPKGGPCLLYTSPSPRDS